MSRGGPSTEGADVFRALGMYVFQGLALEAVSDGGSGWEFRGVRDNNGIVAGSGFYNHLQSSGEHNASSAHSRSTSSANSSPTLLSQSRVSTISLSGQEREGGSRVLGEGISSSGQLGNRIDGCVSGGERVSGGGFPLGSRGMGISGSRQECPVCWLLWNLLHHLVTVIVSSVLLL